MSKAAGWAAACVIAAAVGLLVHHALFHGQAQSFDAVLYARSLWGLAHGVPVNSIVGVHALAIHLHLGLYLLVPLAWLMPAATALVVGQSAALAITAGLVASRFADLAPRWKAGAAVLGAVLITAGAPLVMNPFFFDVHPDLLGIPFAAAGLLRAERRGFDGRAALYLFAACLCREELAMVAAAAALFSPGFRASPRPRLVLAAASLALWILYWLVGRRLIGGAYAVERIVPDELMHGEPSWSHKLEVVGAFVLSSGGLAILGWRWLAAALPGLAFLLAINRFGEHVLNFHYAFLCAPGLCVAAVAGARRALAAPRTAQLGLTLAAAAVAYWAFAAGPGGRKFMAPYFRSSPVTAGAQAVLASLPPGASVSLPFPLAAPYADRAVITREPDDAPVDYLALAAPDFPRAAALVDGADWVLADAHPDGLALLRRAGGPLPYPPSLGRVSDACDAPIGRFPAAGLLLCRIGRRGAEIELIVRRVREIDLGPLRVRVLAPGGDLLPRALAGVFNPRQLAPDHAMRLRAVAPPGGFPAKVVLETTHGVVPGDVIDDAVPVTFPAASN